MKRFLRNVLFVLLVCAFSVAPLFAQQRFPADDFLPIDEMRMPLQQTPNYGNLNQTGWSGNEMLAGYGPLHFSFMGSDRVVMIDADRVPRPGTYSIAHGQVTMRFFEGRVVYMGRIDGSLQTGATIRGMASNGGEQWQFAVTLQQGPVSPPIPRGPLSPVPPTQPPSYTPHPPSPYEMRVPAPLPTPRPPGLQPLPTGHGMMRPLPSIQPLPPLSVPFEGPVEPSTPSVLQPLGR